MDIKKEAIEFIPNLKSFNSMMDEVLASEDIGIEEYEKMVNFGSNLNNIPRFEALVMGIALYEDKDTRNMLLKAIEAELERFILVYSHESEHITNFYKWKRDELNIGKNLDNLGDKIKAHTELSIMTCEVIDEVRNKLSDNTIDDAYMLNSYLRQVINYHQEATNDLQTGYNQYADLCKLEERYRSDKFYYYCPLNISMTQKNRVEILS